jgi:prepilin-type N-terminal cleavage/methylation domain-containing protein
MVMSRRGFSLLEVLAAVALLGILAALSLPLARPGSGSHSTRAGAEFVASVLRDARQQALTSGLATAVGLPSQAGTRPVADSCYQLIGQENPKIVRVLRFRSESLDCQAFLGRYPGPVWSTARPAGLLNASALSPGWNPLGDQDPLLVFWPDGSVTSNVAHDQGEYRCIVGQALSHDGGSPPQLQQAFKPFTVSISLLGAIEVEAGIPGGNPVLISAQPIAGSVAGPASPLPLGSNRDPVLISPFLTVWPPVQSTTLANVTLPGSTATVALDGMLTIEVFARDPDGDPLFCRWSATGPVADSRFSHPEGSKMEWNASSQCWTGRWSWSPPPGALQGQQYTLNCEVFDAKGGIATPASVGAQIPVVHTLSKRKIVYAEENPGRPTTVWTCNWDGTDPKEILSEAFLREVGYFTQGFCIPRFSPDGSVIAVPCVNATDPTDAGIFVCAPDGSGFRRLTVHNDEIEGLCWDPAGRYVYTVDAFPGAIQVLLRWEYSDNVDATYDELARWPQGPTECNFLAIHPSGKFFAKHLRTEINFIWPQTDTLPAKVINLPGNYGEAEFTVDGNNLLADTGSRIFRHPIVWDEATRTVSFSGAPVDMAPGIGDLQSPIPSRDGQWILGQHCPPGILRNCILEVATGKVMILTIPNSGNQDGSHFSP